MLETFQNRQMDRSGRVASVYGFVIVPPPFRAKVVVRTTVAGDLT